MPDDLYEVSQEPDRTAGPTNDVLPQRFILEGFLRREELAHELGISARTIDRWESLRQGPPRVSVGRTILYSIHSVREWLLSKETTPSLVRRGSQAVPRDLRRTSAILAKEQGGRTSHSHVEHESAASGHPGATSRLSSGGR